MTTRYSQEVPARVIRLVMEQETEYPSQWVAIESIALFGVADRWALLKAPPPND